MNTLYLISIRERNNLLELIMNDKYLVKEESYEST